MEHQITLNDDQLAIVRDLLEERLEDIAAELEYFEEEPGALVEGEDELTIEDYEEYRDQVQTLLECLPVPAEEAE